MPEWLPSLTWPDLFVFGMTVFLCLAAAQVPRVGDFVGRLCGRGSKSVAEDPKDSGNAP